jgi:hypothetical protein
VGFELDVRISELKKALDVSRCEGLERVAHDLHVLLRHRHGVWPHGNARDRLPPSFQDHMPRIGSKVVAAGP